MTDHAPTEAPILVPVDVSAHSEAALLWARDLAARISAPMVVLHVIHDPAESPGYYVKALQAIDGTDAVTLQPLEDAARRAMAAFLEDAAARHPELGDPAALDTRLVVGVPTTRILEIAESIGARLVVMGSQGRTGLSHLMIGSKAEQVVRLSPIPVTIVKAPSVGVELDRADGEGA